jgi:hypothetical protein
MCKDKHIQIMYEYNVEQAHRHTHTHANLTDPTYFTLQKGWEMIELVKKREG